MIVKPKVRGFICITAHPEGCAAHVQEQIDYVKNQGAIQDGPKKVLIIGSSTGYGLAARIAAAFGSQASTVGVFFERPASNGRTASAGWYNSVAFERKARAEGLYAKSVNGDAFSDQVKDEVVKILKEDLGPVDLVVYSLAAPRREHPKTGQIHKSTLKPIGEPFVGPTLDTDKDEIKEVTLEPATEQDIADTVAVMGGEDWEMWINRLNEENLLAEGCQTMAFSYIGPKLTWPIYWNGTIGQAKIDLDATAKRIDALLKLHRGSAFVSVNKAVVTQASSAIPVVPLYISILFKVMKEKRLHEGCIEQLYRLYASQMYQGNALNFDEAGRVRIDDWEMKPEIQEAVHDLWSQVTTENFQELSDYEGYKSEFLKLFGFGLAGVDYDADTDPEWDFD
ncbi:MAG: trans-2-enoyl-CoA reductase family protein [Verrucomicrobiae bacterium]|nr:trans-2-enoyl-CoA reductase family protein [Verrucomicrobiae bacterium]